MAEAWPACVRSIMGKLREELVVSRRVLVDNLTADRMHIDKPIQQRVIENLTKADRVRQMRSYRS